jgi:hypothetical protein
MVIKLHSFRDESGVVLVVCEESKAALVALIYSGRVTKPGWRNGAAARVSTTVAPSGRMGCIGDEQV